MKIVKAPMKECPKEEVDASMEVVETSTEEAFALPRKIP